MSDLVAKVTDQNMNWSNNQSIYSGDINSDRIIFNFSDHWDNYKQKTAIFYRSKDEVYQQMLEDDNSCIIPGEILSRPGLITIGVYGVNGKHVLTSEALKYRVQLGATNDQVNVDPPTLTIYEQVISQYGEIVISVDEFINDQIATMSEYHETWTNKTDTFIQEQTDKMDQYHEQWRNEVEQSITDATNAGNLCMSALSDFQLEVFDMDGGTPDTTDTSYEFDINGGYPTI